MSTYLGTPFFKKGTLQFQKWAARMALIGQFLGYVHTIPDGIYLHADMKS